LKFSAFGQRLFIGMRYRRSETKGGTFFFTLATLKRMRILAKQSYFDLFRASINHVIEFQPFIIDAFVLLSDHLHCIWTLAQDDSDCSTRRRLTEVGLIALVWLILTSGHQA
jgi:putative transposase